EVGAPCHRPSEIDAAVEPDLAELEHLGADGEPGIEKPRADLQQIDIGHLKRGEPCISPVSAAERLRGAVVYLRHEPLLAGPAAAHYLLRAHQGNKEMERAVSLLDKINPQ